MLPSKRIYKPFYYHFTKEGLTVAVWQHEDDSYIVAVACTNPKDHYNRKLGRTIAHGRLTCKRTGLRYRTIYKKDELEATLEAAKTDARAAFRQHIEEIR